MGNQLQTPQPTTTIFNYHQKGSDWMIDAIGTEQTPINIVPSTAECSNEGMKMEFFLTDHTLSNIKVQDTGVALTTFGPFSKLRATDVHGDSYEYEALQFHFHAPAEHTINGGQYELELHIVHKMTEESAKRAKTHRNHAVVAVFFQLDKDPKAAPHPFIDALKLDRVGTDINLNMYDLLSEDLVDMTSFFAYKGSLTTPPCTEAVNWYLFETPVKINRQQLNQFDLRWKDNANFACGHGNNRPIQPLGNRTVYKSSNCCVMGKSQEVIKTMTTEVRPPRTELKLTLSRDLMLDDFSMRSHHAKGDTQSFIDTPTFKKKASYLETIESPNGKNMKDSSKSVKTSSYAGSKNINNKQNFSSAIEMKN